MFRTRLILASALFCLTLLGTQLAAQERKSSTPEERQQAVQMINSLEIDPLSKDAKDYRRNLLVWLTNVPDITITLCSNVLGDTKKMKGEYSSELFGQMAYSQAKFIIEHPEQASDESKVQLAGVEGVLKSYGAIKAVKPKVKIELFEELLQKQATGQLEAHIKAGVAGCQKKG